MATLVLAAAGSALGGAVGGSLAGLTSLALGKAAGASIGSLLDQKILGLGSEPVETGKVDRFRVMGSSEGAILPRVFGRMRLAGQIIWSSRFLERSNTSNVGGKGGGQQVKEFSYSINLAVAICEGEVIRIGRIWGDGAALDQATLTWRLHTGSEDQMPDPVIAAIEGLDRAPAYRGTAYVVFENLDLGPFGNRIPQFNFEVFRRTRPDSSGKTGHPATEIRGVALIPGTGEYSLATETVHLERGVGEVDVANIHNDQGLPDIVVSLEQLQAEVPNLESISLVVSWFGSDLRCNRCTIQPAVEQAEQDGSPMAWRVNGVSRSYAKVLSNLDGRPVFGGTPTDASVIQAIEQIREMGSASLFYPFVLMDILPGNSLSDPWSDKKSQPPVPWRGRITLSSAPGQPNSTDKTAEAALEVSSFFGNARPSDFKVENGSVNYYGPDEWSYRRFIFHYAYLCVVAGGVDAFCIGSELRGLTQIRSTRNIYPAVEALKKIASEVRAILGQRTKIGYAADWSEYFGHHPADGSNDVLFNLDTLWAHPEIDFVGIDNYMPLSDWRDGGSHDDISAGSIYNIEYLQGNVAGGEGFDWYYEDELARNFQKRTPIRDKIRGEDWIYRYKDLRGWWENSHYDRLGGEPSESPTEWEPRSKPIWFTELGCPAIDKGTNQPNVFSDPKSSESAIPYFSNGCKDEYIQHCYLKAQYGFWLNPKNNPSSDQYSGRMVDMSRAHVWAWDARPWPDFPQRLDTWTDGQNYRYGHWLNGRTSLVSLSDVVSELCADSGIHEIDSSNLWGIVTGYSVQSVESGRQSLQGLMLVLGFDVSESIGQFRFRSRNVWCNASDVTERLVKSEESPSCALTRAPLVEVPGRVSLSFIRADMYYQSGMEDALYPFSSECRVAQLSVPLVLSEVEAQSVARRWLSEGRVTRESVQIRLSNSDLQFEVGDMIVVDASRRQDIYRIDQIVDGYGRYVFATLFCTDLYNVYQMSDVYKPGNWIVSQAPVYSAILDLPVLRPSDRTLCLHIAVTRRPWSGMISVYSSNSGLEFKLEAEIKKSAIIGKTLETITYSKPGCWSNRSLKVEIYSGILESRSADSVLDGANVAAIRFGGTGDWEIIQFCSVRLLTAPGIYELSQIIRGQAGTEFVMPEEWPAGTEFIMINDALTEVSMNASRLQMNKYFCIGPAVRTLGDESFIDKCVNFRGVALRPYSPTDICALLLQNGDIVFTWKRRGILNGDDWDQLEIPNDEFKQCYSVLVYFDEVCIIDTVVYECIFTLEAYYYESKSDYYRLIFKVSQISKDFGAGPYARFDYCQN